MTGTETPRDLVLAGDRPGQFTPASGAAADGTVKFVKDLISVGEYTHPQDGWRLEVTRDRMDAWVASFRRMREDGIDVEVVVDHSFSARDEMGCVTDIWRVGDTLYGLHEMRGEGVPLARKCRNVSIWLDGKYRSGNGKGYGEAIVHSSISQQPIAPGQKPFIEIAASATNPAGRRAAVLSKVAGDEELTMDKDTLKALREMAGDAELAEDKVLEAIGERLKKNGEDLAAASSRATAAEQELEKLKEKVTALESKGGEDKGDDKTPLQIAASRVDVDILDELADGAEAKLDALACGAKPAITPACRDALKKVLIGGKGGHHALMLSKRAAGTEQSIARQVIDALASNDPIALGEQTASQAKALSRHVPGEGDRADDKEIVAGLVAAAGGSDD